MKTTTNDHQEPILKEAWQRHAELDDNANNLKKRYTKLRKWVLILGIIAVFLAIVTAGISNLPPENSAIYAPLPPSLTSFLVSPQLAAILKVLLIAAPLLASIVAAFTNRELGDGRWLAMRAGGEEIAKDIYIYRTVLANAPNRNRWLSNRLAVILRQVYKSSGNKLDTAPFTGNIPVHYYPDNPNSDSGFTNLTADEYIRFRLLDQLNWHEKKLMRIGRDKQKLTLAILAMGGLGALLAGIGGPFAVWVALTASLTAALIGWEELQNREATIGNYSKVRLELTILRDYWYGLTAAEKTDSEFFKLVLAAENLLWMQNAEYIRSMQEALSAFEDEDARLVEDVIRNSEAMHRNLQESLYAETASVLAHTNEQLTAVVKDAGTTVEDLINDASAEARAYTDSAEAVVDTAVAESTAVRSHLEARATTEVEAWADAAEGSVDVIATESLEIRKTAETAVAGEVEAWGDSAETAIEGAATESAAIRAATAAAAAAETEAWGDSAQKALDAAVTESDAMRAAADTAVDMAADTTASARESAMAEADAWQDTANDALESAQETSAAARQLTETEVDAWQDTAAETLDAAAAQSTSLRTVAEEATDAAVAQSEAWQTTASKTAAAAEAESDAWRQTTENAVETAVAQSAAARKNVEDTIKYALEFRPISTDDNLATEMPEDLEEVVYTAVPDVKFAINFKPANENEQPVPENGSSADDETENEEAVNQAVNRILEEGINVADDAIKEALAKASQKDES